MRDPLWQDGDQRLPEEQRGTMDRRIEAARTIIETGYHKPLRVPELATRVALTRSHMEFLFKRETGVTFKACLREVRLTQAAQSLFQDHSSVKQAAFSVGYHDVSRFARDFKREFGTAPSGPQVTETQGVRSASCRHRATESAGFVAM